MASVSRHVRARMAVTQISHESRPISFPLGLIATLFVFANAFSIASYAQQGLMGSYQGNYVEFVSGHPTPHHGVLQLSKMENGKVAGKFNITGQSCSGEYAVTGTYSDSKLDLRTSEGSLRGCGNEPLVLSIEGDTLTGTYSTMRITLSRK